MRSLDVAIVALFVAYSLAAGLRARRQASRDLDEYFLAGRTLRGWQAGMSMAATQFAADTPLVVAGLVATAGLFSLWQRWSYGLAFLLLGFLFAPGWRRAGVLTDAAFAELRYSGRGALLLRALRALLYGVVFNGVVVAMVLFAGGLVAERFLFWSDWLPPALFEPVVAFVRAAGIDLASARGGADAAVQSAENLISIVAVVGFALSYSTTGGLRGVVATDLGQLAIMLLATAGFALVALQAAGGPQGVLAALRQLDARDALGGITAAQLYALTPDAARGATGGLVAVFALQWLLQRNADGSGYLAQRTMACRSDVDARRAAVIFAFLQIGLRSLLWVPLALALLALFPPAPELAGEALVRDREASFVLGMRELLPAGLRGLLVTAMLAALASTLDTHLNWGASYLAHDVYGRLYCEGLRRRAPDPRAQVWVARGSNLAVAVVAGLVLVRLDSVQSAWKATLVLGAGIGAVTVLRWIWWRVTAWGELTALLLSFAFAPIALAAIDSEAVQMLGAAALATLGATAVSWLGPPTEAETLRTFSERVRPSGFWGPYAQAGARGDLLRALAATAAAATTLYGSLLGALWLGLPGPEPPPLASPLAALALALLALPFWLPVLQRR